MRLFCAAESMGSMNVAFHPSGDHFGRLEEFCFSSASAGRTPRRFHFCSGGQRCRGRKSSSLRRTPVMMHFHFGSDLHLRRPATGRNEAKDAINKNAPILMLSLKAGEEKIPAQRRRLDVVARSNDNIKDLTTILFRFFGIEYGRYCMNILHPLVR